MRSVSLPDLAGSFVTYGGVATLATLSSTRSAAFPFLQASSVIAPPVVTTALAASVVCVGAEAYRAIRQQPPAPRPLGAQHCDIDRLDRENAKVLLKNTVVVGAQMLLAAAALHGLGIGMCLSAPVMIRHWIIGALEAVILLGLYKIRPRWTCTNDTISAYEDLSAPLRANFLS